MKIANAVRGVLFTEVKHGTIVQIYDTNSTLYIGVKVAGEKCDGVLVLKCRPLADEQETILWVHDNACPPWGNDFLLEFPDAILVSKAFTKLPDGQAPKTGSLTIHHDGATMYLTKAGGPPLSAKYVDMKTGKAAKANDTAKPALVITKWAIVVPMVEAGEVLIEFSEEDRAVR
jgi:hypothetical protein